MPAVKRAQLIVQTWAGEVVTSIQYEFQGVVNEYITLASLVWLLNLEPDQVDAFVEKTELITQYKHGQEWVNCSDAIPMFGWTPTPKRGSMEEP